MILITIAAGSVATVYFAEHSSGVTSTVTTLIGPTVVSPNSTDSESFYGPNASHVQFTLYWSADRPVRVTLAETMGCVGSGCGQLTLAVWPSNQTGRWTTSQRLQYPVTVTFLNMGTDPAAISGAARSVTNAPFPFPWLALVAVGVSAAALFVLGGLALFLGLFLRHDPYGPRPPVVSQSAEDVEEILAENQADPREKRDDSGR
jgi:hypothetical protein